MNLGKAYSSSELESLLDAKCSINTDLKLDTISTLSHPVSGSLGFINKMGDFDTSKFKALIVDDSYSNDQFENIALFRTKNVMRSVSLLLKDVSKNQAYIRSEKYPHVTMGANVKIGKNCQIAGQVGIVGHIEIADNVIVMAKTLVTKSLKEAGVYSGVMPIQKHKDSLKFIAKIKK